MRLLIDMNLTPRWCEALRSHGWEAKHWSEVGDPRAEDSVIMQWARDHDYIVFTHDLDFGAMLAMTHATGPSVIQIRCEDSMPDRLGLRLVGLLKIFEPELTAGALLVVDEHRQRVRVLPLAPE